MQKLFKIPFLFLFIAALIGLFLRYLMIAPLEGFVFSYWLHAHSHLMFLGWVFNVLYLALVTEFANDKKFKTLFWVFQALVVGMMISFPQQGYGTYSIIFSALHTFCAFVFIVLFFRSTRNRKSLALSLARYALLFFALSSLGPFSLGYLKAHGLEHSNMYRFALYFYLHFQYNGFFFFAVLSLLTKMIEHKLDANTLQKIERGCYILLIACVPGYLLSTLWAHPSIIYNGIGLVAAVLQLIGAFVLIRSFLKILAHNKNVFHPRVKFLFGLSALSLGMKSVLQLISSLPDAAEFANTYRSVTIAYLHLVLIGCITLFLIGWLLEKKILTQNCFAGLIIFLTGFIFSEILLVSAPWYHGAFLNPMIFFFSAWTVVGIGWCTLNAFTAGTSA